MGLLMFDIIWFALHPVAELVLEKASTSQKSDEEVSLPTKSEDQDQTSAIE